MSNPNHPTPNIPIPKANVLACQTPEDQPLRVETMKPTPHSVPVIQILSGIMGLRPPTVSAVSSVVSDEESCEPAGLLPLLNLQKSASALFLQMKQKFLKSETEFSLQIFIVFLKEHQFSVSDYEILSGLVKRMKEIPVEQPGIQPTCSFLISSDCLQAGSLPAEEIKRLISERTSLENQRRSNLTNPMLLQTNVNSLKENLKKLDEAIERRTKRASITEKESSKLKVEKAIAEAIAEKETLESQLQMLDNEYLKKRIAELTEILKPPKKKKTTERKSSDDSSAQQMQQTSPSEDSSAQQMQQTSPSDDLFSIISKAKISEMNLLNLFMTAANLCLNEGIEQYSSEEFLKKIKEDLFSTLLSSKSFLNLTSAFYCSVHQLNHPQCVSLDGISVSKTELEKGMKSFFLKWNHCFNLLTDPISVDFEMLFCSVMNLLSMTLNHVGVGKLSSCDTISEIVLNSLAMIHIVLERIFGKSSPQESCVFDHFFQRAAVFKKGRGPVVMFSLKNLEPRFSACVTNFITRRDQILHLNGVANRDDMYKFVSNLFREMTGESPSVNLFACLNTFVGSGKTFLLAALLAGVLKIDDVAFSMSACPSDVANFLAMIYSAISDFRKSSAYKATDETCKAFDELYKRLLKFRIHTKPISGGEVLEKGMIHVFVLLPTLSSEVFLKSFNSIGPNRIAVVWCDDFNGWQHLLNGMPHQCPTIISGADMTFGNPADCLGRKVMTCSSERSSKFEEVMQESKAVQVRDFPNFLGRHFGKTVHSLNTKLTSMGINLTELDNARLLPLHKDQTRFFILLNEIIVTDYRIAYDKIMTLYYADSVQVYHETSRPARSLLYIDGANFNRILDCMASLFTVPNEKATKTASLSRAEKDKKDRTGSSSRKAPKKQHGSSSSRNADAPESSLPDDVSSNKPTKFQGGDGMHELQRATEDIEAMKLLKEPRMMATPAAVVKTPENLSHDPRYLIPSSTADMVRQLESILKRQHLSPNGRIFILAMFGRGVGFVSKVFSQEYIDFVTYTYKLSLLSFLFTDYDLAGLNLGPINKLFILNEISKKVFGQLEGRLGRTGQSPFLGTLMKDEVINLCLDEFAPANAAVVAVPHPVALNPQQYDFSPILVEAIRVGVRSCGTVLVDMLKRIFPLVDSEFDESFLQRLANLFEACFTRLFSREFHFSVQNLIQNFDGSMMLGHILDQCCIPSFFKKATSDEQVVNNVEGSFEKAFGKGILMNPERYPLVKRAVVIKFFKDFSHITHILSCDEKDGRALSCFSTIPLIDSFLKELINCSSLLDCARSIVSGLTQCLDQMMISCCFCKMDALLWISSQQLSTIVSLLEAKRNQILDAEKKKNDECGNLLKRDPIAELKAILKPIVREIRNQCDIAQRIPEFKESPEDSSFSLKDPRPADIEKWIVSTPHELDGSIRSLKSAIVKNLPNGVSNDFGSQPAVRQIIDQLGVEIQKIFDKASESAAKAAKTAGAAGAAYKELSDADKRRIAASDEVQFHLLLRDACEFYNSSVRLRDDVVQQVRSSQYDLMAAKRHLDVLVAKRERLLGVGHRMATLKTKSDDFANIMNTTFQVMRISSAKKFSCLSELKAKLESCAADTIVLGRMKPDRCTYFELSVESLSKFYTDMCSFMCGLRLDGLSKSVVFHPELFEGPINNEVSKESLSQFLAAITDLEKLFATLIVDFSPENIQTSVAQSAELAVQIDACKNRIHNIEVFISTLELTLPVFKMA